VVVDFAAWPLWHLAGVPATAVRPHYPQGWRVAGAVPDSVEVRGCAFFHLSLDALPLNIRCVAVAALTNTSENDVGLLA